MGAGDQQERNDAGYDLRVRPSKKPLQTERGQTGEEPPNPRYLTLRFNCHDDRVMDVWPQLKNSFIGSGRVNTVREDGDIEVLGLINPE